MLSTGFEPDAWKEEAESTIPWEDARCLEVKENLERNYL